ncbi:MAG: hypothetical protein ABH810_03325, partial [bacterium]
VRVSAHNVHVAARRNIQPMIRAAKPFRQYASIRTTKARTGDFSADVQQAILRPKVLDKEFLNCL